MVTPFYLYILISFIISVFQLASTLQRIRKKAKYHVAKSITLSCRLCILTLFHILINLFQWSDRFPEELVIWKEHSTDDYLWCTYMPMDYYLWLVIYPLCTIYLFVWNLSPYLDRGRVNKKTLQRYSNCLVTFYIIYLHVVSFTFFSLLIQTVFSP